jgi:hypothetical protein
METKGFFNSILYHNPKLELPWRPNIFLVAKLNETAMIVNSQGMYISWQKMRKAE